MKKLVIGTSNKDKLAELRSLTRGMRIKVMSIADFGTPPEVIEDGETFIANASKKARIYSEFCGELTLADDSGLCVNALDGKPGVYSARYAGENCSYQDNNKKLIQALKGVPPTKRGARFVSVVALYKNGKRVKVIRGECVGRIAEAISGGNGFGYDPIFIPKGESKTFAEISKAKKNMLSHRGKALRVMKEFLEWGRLRSCDSP